MSDAPERPSVEPSDAPDEASSPGLYEAVASIGDRQRAGLTFVILVAVIWLLWVAKAFLVPLVLAIFALIIVSALDRFWRRVKIRGVGIPPTLGTILSALVIAIGAAVVALLVIDSAQSIARRAPEYQELLRARYTAIIDVMENRLGLEDVDEFDALIERIDFTRLIRRVATGTMEMLGSVSLVLIYLFFMLIERQFLGAKLRSIFGEGPRQAQAREMIERIGRDVGVYVGMKTFVSLITAAPAFAIMRFVGLDFAEFWTLLIFVLNFIPNIGSLIATTMPALLSIIQFGAMREFLIVAIGITTVQLIVANLVEPTLMSRSLNMSALVVIVSLVGWSLLWGVAGAFLCVPMTVVAMIVLSHFPSTRGGAIMLSRDGDIGVGHPASGDGPDA